MQSWSRNYPRQIDVLLFDAFSALCLANTIEPLRAANDLAGKSLFSWRFSTVDGSTVRSSSGMEVRADAALSTGSGDMLIAMPSYRYLDHCQIQVLVGLRAASMRYKVMAGFDTGSWLLAAAGLLDNRPATIHWEELGKFEEAFPDVHATRSRYVIDGDRITCSGAQAAFDLMTELIGQDQGPTLRLEVASLFMTPDTTASESLPRSRNKAVRRAIAAMQENIEAPLAIPQIARLAGIGQKELEARIAREFDQTPQALYRHLRLIAARKLAVETTLPVAEIALRCGYQNPSALTRAFRKTFGMTPQSARNALD
jgi:transcriptional regulator GlxA family with amidase domain